MIKQILKEDLKKALSGANFEKSTDIVLSIPKKTNFGDYTTNIALQQSTKYIKNSSQSPSDIANAILKNLGHPEYLERIEVVGGHINFFIKPGNLGNDIKNILNEGDSFGKSESHKGKKARVEFISANPTGPMHFGNARGGPIGDTLSNVLQAVGYEVLREYIHNDVGEQVKALGATLKSRFEGRETGENQYQGEYIDELVKTLKGQLTGKNEEEIGKLAVGILFDENIQDAKDMGISFDLIVKESKLRQEVPPILDYLKKHGYLKEHEGALWFAPNDNFLKDRETVVVKSNGDYTYFTADIVYHKQKFELSPDLVVDVFGSNHHGHVARLQAVIKALGFDVSKFVVILYQYVRFKRGNDIVKMSKRAGNFVTVKEVLDEVGVDALRFALLQFAPQTHIDFDLELFKKKSNDNPVFYVQYAHARMASILVKAEVFKEIANLSLLKEQAEMDLIKHLLEFPGLVEEISRTFEVHKLTTYAITLADLFHKFYEQCPVLYAGKENLTKARVELVKASKIVLANTLSLMGISAPDKM